MHHFGLHPNGALAARLEEPQIQAGGNRGGQGVGDRKQRRFLGGDGIHTTVHSSPPVAQFLAHLKLQTAVVGTGVNTEMGNDAVFGWRATGGEGEGCTRLHVGELAVPLGLEWSPCRGPHGNVCARCAQHCEGCGGGTLGGPHQLSIDANLRARRNRTFLHLRKPFDAQVGGVHPAPPFGDRQAALQHTGPFGRHGNHAETWFARGSGQVAAGLIPRTHDAVVASASTQTEMSGDVGDVGELGWL